MHRREQLVKYETIFLLSFQLEFGHLASAYSTLLSHREHSVTIHSNNRETGRSLLKSVQSYAPHYRQGGYSSARLWF